MTKSLNENQLVTFHNLIANYDKNKENFDNFVEVTLTEELDELCAKTARENYDIWLDIQPLAFEKIFDKLSENNLDLFYFGFNVDRFERIKDKISYLSMFIINTIPLLDDNVTNAITEYVKTTMRFSEIEKSHILSVIEMGIKRKREGALING